MRIQKQLFSFVADEAITERAKIKSAFLRKESEFHRHDIEDLENTIDINKKLINILITNCKEMGDNSKKALIILNQENKYLNNNIKLLKSQRDYYHSQNLISKQIIEGMKAKHLEELNEQKAKVTELLENLNQKEYIIQDAQYKYTEIIKELKEHAKEDPIIAELLWKLDTTSITTLGKITNVIKENKELLKEIARLNERLNKLEEKVNERSTDIKEETCKN